MVSVLRMIVWPIPSLVFSRKRRAFHLLPGGEGRDEGGRETIYYAEIHEKLAPVIIKAAEDCRSPRRWRAQGQLAAVRDFGNPPSPPAPKWRNGPCWSSRFSVSPNKLKLELQPRPGTDRARLNRCMSCLR
jgi:hypothetical protein